MFLRYWNRARKPLTINSPEDFDKAFNRFRFLKPRTIYASVNVYGKLEVPEDTEEPSNIVSSTPVWDIDASLDTWEWALKAVDVIISCLDKEGLNRSVFLKWSGRGIHVHVHERAFSKKVLNKHNPLDVSFSVVEYVLRKARSQLTDLVAKAPQSSERPLKVENKIDLKRVFTAPLSLHRSLDLCCVCFKPNDIYNFNPDWAKPESYRHDETWKVFEQGEGDTLAEKSLAEIGGYNGWAGTLKTRTRGTRKQTTEIKIKKPSRRKLGRFQVMGLLQAVRYYLVTGNLERAKSFGLNRAIFYAWAKRRGRVVPARPTTGTKAAVAQIEERKVEQLGDERAFVSPRGWFIIGNAEQKPSDYDRQIAKRIEATAISHEAAWTAAIEYLKTFPKETLLDQQKFYREAYRPIRDSFLSLIKQNSH